MVKTNCENKVRRGSLLRLHTKGELNLWFGNEDINLGFPFNSGSSHVTDIFLLLFCPPIFAPCSLLFKTKAATPRWWCLLQGCYHSSNTSDSHSEDGWLESRIVRLLAICVPFQKKALASCSSQATELLSHIVLQLFPVYCTRYWLDGPGIKTLWGRDFPHPSRPALRPTRLLQNGYRFSFQAVKRPGLRVTHPNPSTTEVKERVALYLYTHSGPSWPVLRLPLHQLFYLLYNLTQFHKFTQHSQRT